MRMRSLIFLAAAVFSYAGCIEVPGDRILIGDLTPVRHELESLPADTAIGLSPSPGVERTITARDLRSTLHGQAIPDFADVCVVRHARELNAQEIVEAMAAELKENEIRVELLDYSRGQVPDGRLEFRKIGLPSSARTDVLWRGRIITDTGRSFPVSARIRLLRTVEAVFARTKIAAGTTISPDAVETRRVDLYALAADRLPTADKIIGAEFTRTVPAGELITNSLLRAHPSVRRGEPLAVSVRSGATTLHFDAKAEGTGRIGDRMLVRNPMNGRLVSVVIAERGKGMVDVRK
jgi:flagella basal body P-ring formation protein FlgA